MRWRRCLLFRQGQSRLSVTQRHGAPLAAGIYKKWGMAWNLPALLAPTRRAALARLLYFSFSQPTQEMVVIVFPSETRNLSPLPVKGFLTPFGMTTT